MATPKLTSESKEIWDELPDPKERWYGKLGRGALATIKFPNKIFSMRALATGAVIITAGVLVSHHEIRDLKADAHKTAVELGTESADSFSDQLAKKQTAENAAKSILELCHQSNAQHESGNNISTMFANGLCDMAQQFLDQEHQPNNHKDDSAKIAPGAVPTTTTVHHNSLPAPIIAQSSPRP